MKRITKKDVLAAVHDSGGIISTIAKRLSCNWNTARAYCEKWEDTKQALTAEQEAIADLAETAIVDAIKSKDLSICKWYLSTKGKHRGYSTDTDQQAPQPCTDDNEIQIILSDCEDSETMNL